MPKPQDDRIEKAVTGIVRLQDAYAMERKVFLGGVVVGILLLTFLSIMTAFGKVKREDWVMLFGPSGIFLGTCTGAMIYFNKSLDIIRKLSEAGRDG
jgi:hypothetical protein